MTELLSGTSFFAVVLTLGAYQAGILMRKKWDSPICNPILIAVILVIVVLALFDISNNAYQTEMTSFSWLLTPATICLAIPLHEQLHTLKREVPAILVGVLCGTVASIGGIFLMGRLFGLDEALLASLLPKSITTAMGIALSGQIGGVPAITTAAIIITGILGSLSGEFMGRILHLKSNIALGAAFGTAAHVIGTARATELDPLTGAVSSLSLVVAGILTAVLLPTVPMI